jgi:hypothetical protein
VSGRAGVVAVGSQLPARRERIDRAVAEVPLDAESLVPSRWIEWFVIAQTAIPALLYLPGSQVIRLPVRIGSYGVALAGFGIWWAFYSRPRLSAHPARGWLMGVLGCLALMILHPLTNSPQAGVAQTMLYFAVFCPLLWAPAFVSTPRQLMRILAILLVCNGINSIVGVLQVYDPARWMPTELSFAFTPGSFGYAAASYVGPNGRVIIRPPGLFDTPGAVCGPGTIAALLGLIFALEPLAWWKRGVALILSLAGVSAIYLSHVRTNLVIAVAMMAAYVVMLAINGRRQRLMTFGIAAAGILAVGLTAATTLGGDSIQQRFSTLLSDDPRSLYFASRGQQVQFGFERLAVDHPFGAGLGRWGLMRGYFGDVGNLDSSELWAEVQPNAWIIDGGFLLLGLYTLALLATVAYEVRLVRTLWNSDDRLCAAAVAAVNVGTLALIFTFVPFTTQVGLQFWFLEGALHGAMHRRAQR